MEINQANLHLAHTLAQWAWIYVIVVSAIGFSALAACILEKQQEKKDGQPST